MKKLILGVITLCLLIACQKESLSDIELQTTTTVSNIQAYKAEITVAGQVLTSSESFSWGVAYSLTSIPKLDNNRVTFMNSGNTVTDMIMLENLLPEMVYYVQPFCERNSEFYFSDEIVSFQTDSIPYEIGEYGPAGGLVYYVDPAGWGLEMSTYEYANNDWGCLEEVLGTTDTIGAGSANTALILTDCPEVGTAPDLCNNHTEGGFTNWHLPSRADLELIHDSLESPGYWEPSGSDYLSSTDCTNPSYGYASYYAYDIVDGHGISAQKGIAYRFFPVRRFEF